jgi:hypothetical protein
MSGGFVGRGIRALVVSLLVVFAACNSEEKGESVDALQQGLSDNDRILGFEAASDWSVPVGTLSSSDTRVEGEHSLAVANTGSQTLASGAVSSLASVGNEVTIDVFQPSPHPNPYWLGAVRLIYRIPSKGIFWED